MKNLTFNELLLALLSEKINKVNVKAINSIFAIKYPLLVILLAFIGGFSPVMAQQMITNGSFETGNLAPWVNNAQTVSSVTNSNALSGQHSLKLAFDGRVEQSISNLTIGASYILTGFTKYDGTKLSEDVIWFGIEYQDGSNTVNKKMMNKGTAFKRHFISFTATSTSAKVYIESIVPGNNATWAYVDKISLIEVDKVSNASVYYVDTNGSDITGDGSLSTPWATLQFAIDVNQSITQDVTIKLIGGTYDIGTYRIEIDGDLNTGGTLPGNWLTIKNYDSTEVIIDGNWIRDEFTTGATRQYMYIRNAKNVRIQGLIFEKMYANWAVPIKVEGGDSFEFLENTIRDTHFTSNVNLRDNPVSGHACGCMHLSGTNPVDDSEPLPLKNVKINNNEIHNLSLGYHGECITLNGNVDGFEIKNNHIYDVTATAIDIAGGYGYWKNDTSLDHARNGVLSGNVLHDLIHSAGIPSGAIYIDGGWNTIIEQNDIYDNMLGIVANSEAHDGTTKNITMRNNYIRDNQYSGIQISAQGDNTTTKDINVFGNTIYDNIGNDIVLRTVNANNRIESILIVNNIILSLDNTVYDFQKAGGSIIQNVTSNYNMFWSLNGNANQAIFDWQDGNTYTSWSSYRNGTFQDGNSYYVFPFSVPNPGVGCGDPNINLPIGIADFVGNNRVIGSRIDIGAIEDITSSARTSTGKKTLEDELTEFEVTDFKIYPNPVKNRLNIRSNTDLQSIQVFDVAGREYIKHEGLKTNEYDLDTEELPNGIYFLKVIDEMGKIKTSKFVK